LRRANVENAMHGFISKWNETTIQASIDQAKTM
jgi:hypothetical protein